MPGKENICGEVGCRYLEDRKCSILGAMKSSKWREIRGGVYSKLNNGNCAMPYTVRQKARELDHQLYLENEAK